MADLDALTFALHEVDLVIVEENIWCLPEVAAAHAQMPRRYEVFAEQSGDTALVVALVLLRLNGYYFVCDHDYLYDSVDRPCPSAKRIAESLWTAYIRAPNLSSYTLLNMPSVDIEEDVAAHQSCFFARLAVEIMQAYSVNADYGILREQADALELHKKHEKMLLAEQAGNHDAFWWLAHNC